MATKIVTYARDLTEHDKTLHGVNIPTHTSDWYKLFDDACPVCRAKAVFESYEMEVEILPPLQTKPKQSQF